MSTVFDSSTQQNAANLATDPECLGRAKIRREVVTERSNQWLGKTTLAIPLMFRVYAPVALCLAALILAFLVFGRYAQTESVSAIIAPDGGPAKVFSDQSGVVTEVFVRPGDKVGVGALLFRIRKRHEPDSLDTLVPLETQKATGGASFFVVEAPVGGRVYKLEAKVGDQTQNFKSEPMATIAADSALIVEAKVTSVVQARVRIGTPVQLELDAFNGRPEGTLKAQVIAVAAEPTDVFDFSTGGSARSYNVVLRIDATTLAIPSDELLGKTVQVKFALEKRRLYQWLLDPLQRLFTD